MLTTQVLNFFSTLLLIAALVVAFFAWLVGIVSIVDLVLGHGFKPAARRIAGNARRMFVRETGS